MPSRDAEAATGLTRPWCDCCMRSLSRTEGPQDLYACRACDWKRWVVWCARCDAWRRLVEESEAAAKTCLQCQVLLQPSRYFCQSCGNTYAMCECLNKKRKTDTTTVMGGLHDGEGEKCRYPPCSSCGNQRERPREEHAFEKHVCLSCRKTQGAQTCVDCLQEKKQEDHDEKK